MNMKPQGYQNTRSFKNKARLGESKDEMVSLKPNQIALIEQEFGTKRLLIQNNIEIRKLVQGTSFDYTHCYLR